MVDKIKNCFLVNAPAGSGKTTQIKAMVLEHIAKNPKDNILCITYTNRAADELSKDIDSSNVFIGTIHSFLHSFMKRYFTHNDILSLYYEVYGEKIQQRVDNIEQEEHITTSNDKYKEKYGELSYEIIKANIKSVSYNESPFNSLYYGGLSHDDLISFSKQIFNRFPIVQKRIASKYQLIFIDEYQDTMADVLEIFFESVVGSGTQLYLFGDRMQQIYKNYDGSFEEKFKIFDTSKALQTNYRSVTEIVELLNKIYNDSSFEQNNSFEMKLYKSDFPPRIIVSDDVAVSISEVKKSAPDTLVLYLLNRDRFSDIGALNLYEAYEGMEKYSFGKTYSAANILTMAASDNPDSLMRLLYCIVGIKELFIAGKYGLIIQTLKNHKIMFCKDNCRIRMHSDKQKLVDSLIRIFAILEDDSKTIADLLSVLEETLIADKTYIEGVLSDDDYKNVFNVPAIELKRVVEYLSDPKVSTQHGVKGESHDSVVFVAADSRNPVVHMYRFFNMWSQVPITLKSFHEFYYAYTDELIDLHKTLGMKVSELDKDSYIQHEGDIDKKASEIIDKFKNNSYFEFLCKDGYKKFKSKPNVTNAKACLKESTVFGVLNAYKLFYVGCSRARKNLTILLDATQIKGDIELQKKKFIEIGFTI